MLNTRLSVQNSEVKEHLDIRSFLSMLASVYDLFRLEAPFVLTGNQILQQIFHNNMGWDDPLSLGILDPRSAKVAVKTVNATYLSSCMELQCSIKSQSSLMSVFQDIENTYTSEHIQGSELFHRYGEIQCHQNYNHTKAGIFCISSCNANR